MAADIAFVHSGRQRNERKKNVRERANHQVLTMACRDDRRGIAPEIPLLNGQHPFHLKIDQKTACQSTQRSNPISAELRANPQNTVFHQTFIVKCHLSSVKTKVVLLSDRRMTSWNYPAKLQSAGGTPV